MTANMENKAIVNHSDLLVRLTELKVEKENQEVIIKDTFTEYIETFDIFSLFKSNTSNKAYTNDLTVIGLNMATNYIVGLLLGKNNSIKGYLSAMMVKQFTSKIIDSDMLSIITSIGSIIFSKSNHEKTTKQ